MREDDKRNKMKIICIFESVLYIRRGFISFMMDNNRRRRKIFNNEVILGLIFAFWEERMGKEKGTEGGGLSLNPCLVAFLFSFFPSGLIDHFVFFFTTKGKSAQAFWLLDTY